MLNKTILTNYSTTRNAENVIPLYWSRRKCHCQFSVIQKSEVKFSEQNNMSELKF